MRINRDEVKIVDFGLVKVYEHAGNRGKPASAYSRFLDLWKEADRDLPMIRDAGARLASLRSAR